MAGMAIDLCQCPRCGRAHRHAGIPPGLKPRGITRMADNERAVLLIFDRRLTDDELRQIHENRVLSGGGFDWVSDNGKIPPPPDDATEWLAGAKARELELTRQLVAHERLGVERREVIANIVSTLRESIEVFEAIAVARRPSQALQIISDWLENHYLPSVTVEGDNQ